MITSQQRCGFNDRSFMLLVGPQPHAHDTEFQPRRATICLWCRVKSLDLTSWAQIMAAVNDADEGADRGACHIRSLVHRQLEPSAGSGDPSANSNGGIETAQCLFKHGDIRMNRHRALKHVLGSCCAMIFEETALFSET